MQWNFEKFLLAPDGSVVARFRPRTVPDDPEVLAAIEEHLPALGHSGHRVQLPHARWGVAAHDDGGLGSGQRGGAAFG